MTPFTRLPLEEHADLEKVRADLPSAKPPRPGAGLVTAPQPVSWQMSGPIRSEFVREPKSSANLLGSRDGCPVACPGNLAGDLDSG